MPEIKFRNVQKLWPFFKFPKLKNKITYFTLLSCHCHYLYFCLHLHLHLPLSTSLEWHQYLVQLALMQVDLVQVALVLHAHLLQLVFLHCCLRASTL